MPNSTFLPKKMYIQYIYKFRSLQTQIQYIYTFKMYKFNLYSVFSYIIYIQLLKIMGYINTYRLCHLDSITQVIILILRLLKAFQLLVKYKTFIHISLFSCFRLSLFRVLRSTLTVNSWLSILWTSLCYRSVVRTWKVNAAIRLILLSNLEQWIKAGKSCRVSSLRRWAKCSLLSMFHENAKNRYTL